MLFICYYFITYNYYIILTTVCLLRQYSARSGPNNHGPSEALASVREIVAHAAGGGERPWSSERYLYMSIYRHIYIQRERDMHIYIYIYIYVCMYRSATNKYSGIVQIDSIISRRFQESQRMYMFRRFRQVPGI